MKYFLIIVILLPIVLFAMSQYFSEYELVKTSDKDSYSKTDNYLLLNKRTGEVYHYDRNTYEQCWVKM